VKCQIRELVAFDFTPDGAICALRAGRDTQPGLLLLAQHGAVLKEMRLPIAKLPAQVRFSNPATIGGGRFVVAVSDQGEGGVAQFFLADFGAGTVNRISHTTCPSVNAIAGFPDGSFAALTTRWMKYTMAHGLCLFDSKGKLMWSKEQCGYSGKPDDLLSPEDLARCGANKMGFAGSDHRLCWNGKGLQVQKSCFIRLRAIFWGYFLAVREMLSGCS